MSYILFTFLAWLNIWQFVSKEQVVWRLFCNYQKLRVKFEKKINVNSKKCHSFLTFDVNAINF